MSSPSDAARLPIRVERGGEVVDDWAVVEAPLEIRVDGEALTVTLRTPGRDRELVAGLLWAEGIVRDPADLEAVAPVGDRSRPGAIRAVGVLLRESAPLDRERLREAKRALLVSAACGVCGTTSLEGLPRHLRPVRPWTPPAALVLSGPSRMRERQELFDATGGIHAAALFDAGGELVTLHEDVGRHNAVDKVVGAAVLEGRVPLERTLLVVSGRAGYEIVQKAIAAGIPAVASVGAASSLAISLARAAGVCLSSFVRDDRFNRH